MLLEIKQNQCLFGSRFNNQCFYITLDPKPFDYPFLATLDERGQGIPKIGIKEGGERVTNVTRIITQLKDDSTVVGKEESEGSYWLEISSYLEFTNDTKSQYLEIVATYFHNL